jgi:hypothetical protein
MMTKRCLVLMGVLVAGITGGCADMTGAPQPSSSRVLKDGEIPFPTGYQNWPSFFHRSSAPM